MSTNNKNRKIVFVTFYDEDCFAVKLLEPIAEKYNLEFYIAYVKRFDYRRAGYKLNLKSQGYDFLYNGIRFVSNPSPISRKEEQIFIDLIREIDPGFILLSTRTFGLEIARTIFEKVRRLYKVTVIAGGWGPTLQQEDFLEFCDYVCFGEGEKCFEKICEIIREGSSDFREVNNLSYKSNGKMIENPVFPPLSDEEYNKYCRGIKYSFKNSFLIEENKLTRNYSEIPKSPHVCMDKGCPLHCTYCMSSIYGEMYKRKGFLCKKYRMRSVDSVMRQLEIVKSKGAKFIFFRDEIFPFDKKWLSTFLKKYREQIDIPFFGYLRPEFHSTEMVKEIIESGMSVTTLGIQSGSDYIRREIYKRMTKKSEIIQFAKYLKKVGVSFEIHFICNCPFETEKDLIETLDLIYQLPFSDIKVYRFTKFPNSPIDVMIKQKKPKSLPNHVYRWYSILYCMAAIGSISRKFAKLFQSTRLFINKPDVLINYYTEIKPILAESTKLLVNMKQGLKMKVLSYPGCNKLYSLLRKKRLN